LLLHFPKIEAVGGNVLGNGGNYIEINTAAYFVRLESSLVKIK
jgi:hypothetical protein